MKQGLKIKTFVGTSENAVQIQIWTALIAILRQQLLVPRDLWTWLNDPYHDAPLPAPTEQLTLGI